MKKIAPKTYVITTSEGDKKYCCNFYRGTCISIVNPQLITEFGKRGAKRVPYCKSCTKVHGKRYKTTWRRKRGVKKRTPLSEQFTVDGKKFCYNFYHSSCVAIQNPQPLNHFRQRSPDKYGKVRRVAICLECQDAYLKERNAREKDIRMDGHLRRDCGISLIEQNQALLWQKYQCAICGIKSGECAQKRNLSTDHNHRTHKFRGMLCENCNMGIGLFRDNPDVLQKSIQYLKFKYDSHNLISNDRFIRRQQRQAALIQQDGKCALCDGLMDITKKTCHLDHEHATGIIRKALCSNCNTALGKMKENRESLAKAAEYVRLGGTEFARALNQKQEIIHV